MSSKKARALDCTLLKDSRPRAQVQFSSLSLSAGKALPHSCTRLANQHELFLCVLGNLLCLVLVVVGMSVEVTLCISDTCSVWVLCTSSGERITLI
jgi:hypothetical protein